MSSLSGCIRKAGKALNKADADAIKDIYNEFLQSGVPQQEAASQAIEEYLADLQQEREGLIDLAEKAGGDVSAFRGGIRLAQPDKNGELAAELSIIKHLYGGEALPGLDKKKNNARNFAKYLSKRARKLNRGKPLDAPTPRNKDIISEAMYLETVAAMKQTGHAGTWYSDTLREAVAVAGLLHPEITTDPLARSAFIFAVAVTSNGATVGDNTVHAEEIYSLYKKNGKMPIKGYGDVGEAMKKAFKLYNELEDKWGSAVLADFMHTEFTVGELKLLGLEVSGENVDTHVYGSAVFGPKIGQGFLQNLSGNFEPLTMDRWWMRTWGRMVGNLAPEGMSAAEGQAEKLRSILPDNETKIQGMGYTVEELQESDAKLLQFAARIHREYARGGFKEKTDLNKMAKNLDNAVHDPVVAPRNGTERAWIREVVAEARRKLKERGFNVDTASLQALLWYPEKQFYLENGVGNERAKPTDYSQEFQRLAAQRGIPQSRIDGAVASARAGQPAGAAGPGGAQAGKLGKSTRALAAEARQQLLQEAAAADVRAFPKAAYTRRAPKSSQRFVNEAAVVAVLKPAIKVRNTLEKAGLAAPEFLEMAPSEQAAANFFAAAKAAKVSKRQLFKPDEYEMMRTFITEDGSAGFALRGDEVVSIFKDKKADMRGVSQAIARLAIDQGGRWTRTDNKLHAHLLSAQGFRAAARTADETYLVFDRSLVKPYNTGDGVAVQTPSEAEALTLQEVYDLEPRNYPEGSIRLRLEEEPNPITDEQPDNPLSQITKIAATWEDQAFNGPNSARTIRQTMSDMAVGTNAKNLERVLGAIPRRNLRDFVSQTAMPAVTDYIRLANRMDGRRNELLAQYEEIGERWTSYVSKNKTQARTLGELMHAATIAGVDPAAPYKPLKATLKTDADKAADAKRRGDHRILKRWYDSLDQEGREIYKAVRNSYSTQRQSVEVALSARIQASQADPAVKRSLLTELRKRFEASRVSGPYFPLARFGELWASAKDSEGNTIAFSRFEKVKDQREWLKNFRDAGYEVDSGKKQDDMAIAQRIDPKFAAKVTELASKADPGLADEIWQLYLKALPEMSMRKQFLHRKNRLGFTTDAIRSFGHNTFHGAHQLAKLEYMHQMEVKLDAMKEQSRALEQREDPEALWGNAVYREMTRRHEWARNPEGSVLATMATGFGFAWYLGTTPAAAMVNLTQTAIVGLPVLAAQFGWGKSSGHLLKAAAQFAGGRGNLADKLRGDERKAFDEAHRIGLFDKTMSHDLAGTAEQGMDYNSKWRTGAKIVSWMFHQAERFNREVTFLAAYRAGREQGLSHNDAVIKGEDLTWDAHFDYNNVNRPRYLQSDAAKVLLLFRQYSLNMTYRLCRDFNDSIKGATPEQKKQARTRFAGILGQTFIFAGATGLPMYWMVAAVANALLGDDDEPYDFTNDTRAHLAQMFSPKVAEIIMKGPMDALTGVTVSSRVSLNNLWLRDPPASLEGEDLWLHYVGEAAGPIPAIGGGVFKTAKDLGEGHVDRALESSLPKLLKDLAKTFRYLQDGVQSRRGDIVVPKEELTKLDLFYQAIGFTPAKITMQYEQNNALKNAERHILDRRARLMDTLFLSARNGDDGTVRETMQNIAQFNKVNPSIAIDFGTIMSSAKSRFRYSMESIGGVTLNKNLRFLAEQKRFTPRRGGAE